ncbi:MAG: TadE/TadG family type IV pilus assembly protein [Pirellulales bacterium]
MRIRYVIPKRAIGRRNIKCRTGAAVVEFAVVAPVLILLLLGMIECGRMIMVQQSLTTAVREGARIATIEGNSAATSIDAVQSFLAGTGIKGAKVAVAPINTTVAHGQAITVSVSVPFREVSWLPNPFFFANKTLSSAATMRRETPM